MSRTEKIVLHDGHAGTRSLFDRARDTWQAAKRSFSRSPLNIKDPSVAKYFTAGPPAASGISVSESTALTLSTFWAAVQLIAGDVASLPLHVYKRLPNGGRERQHEGDRVQRILHSAANPEMSALSVREAITACALTWSNGYAEIERDIAGRPLALWPLHPDRVAQVRGEDGRLRYRVASGTQDVIFEAGDIFHLHGLSFTGAEGAPMIDKARESIALGLAAERFGGSFFGNGSQFGGLLIHPKQLGERGKKNLREALEQRHQGVDRSHRLVLLEEDMKYQQLGIPPETAQFLQTRQFQVAEIARWFNIPPTKLGDLSRATYSNSEQEQAEYYRSSLRRWLVRWEQEIALKLFLPSEREILYAEHLVDAILRADTATRYEAYHKGRLGGWLSVNDIRQLENLPPIGPAGDTYLEPLNMQPAGGSQRSIGTGRTA